jgi:hypothetical protein
MEMEHPERQQWVEQVARINVRLNEAALNQEALGEGNLGKVGAFESNGPGE